MASDRGGDDMTSVDSLQTVSEGELAPATEGIVGPLPIVTAAGPPLPETTRRAVVYRGVWTFATQAVSSGSNFILTVLVLATASARDFAVVSIAVLSYLFLAQLARSVVGIPVLVVQSRALRRDQRLAEAERSAGTALAGGLFAAPLLAAVGLAWPEVAASFLVLAVAIPLLLVQDVLRHIAVARGSPQVATLADAVWLALQVTGSTVALATDRDSAILLLAIWAVSGAGSALLLAVRLGVRPAVTGSRRWFADHRVLCRRVTAEFVVNSGSYYMICYGLVALAGANELGYFRAAQALFGPASVILLGGTVFGVPESVRLCDEPRMLTLFAVRLSALLTVLCITCGGLVYALLPHAGLRLFPDSWAAVRDVVPWLTALGAAIGTGAGPLAALRARDSSRWIMNARAFTGAVALGAGLPATAAWGAQGALASLGVSEWLLAVRAWVRLTEELRTPRCSGLGQSRRAGDDTITGTP